MKLNHLPVLLSHKLATAVGCTQNGFLPLAVAAIMFNADREIFMSLMERSGGQVEQWILDAKFL